MERQNSEYHNMANQYTNTVGQEQLNLIGKKFGRLLVLSYDEEISKQKRRDCYLCHCDCGTEKVIRGLHLRYNQLPNCGCIRRETCKELCKQIHRTGENHPNYLHGFTKEGSDFRKAINERDRVCQYSDNEHNGQLEAHHLDGDPYNHVLENGILLCRRHHNIVTRSGNVWRPELCLSL